MTKTKKYKIINRSTGKVFESYNYFSDTNDRIEYLNKLFKKDKFYYTVHCVKGVYYILNN